jgi:hypothetical protein
MQNFLGSLAFTKLVKNPFFEAISLLVPTGPPIIRVLIALTRKEQLGTFQAI